VFGAVANASLTHAFAHPPGAIAGAIPKGADAATLAISGNGPSRSSAAGEFVEHALNAAAHDVFVGIAVLAVLGVAFLLLMPHRTHELTLD
jgi:hypothetical protein